MFTDSKNTQSVSTDKNLTKNEEALKAKIPAHLRIYEQLKEWSDLGQWLLKLQQILQTYPAPLIPKKKLLCKRLAQCLSPVWNKAIHENALLIYDLVLQHLTSDPEYTLALDLPLFSVGLFPFFGIASIQCKPMVLTLYEKYYFPLGKQLVPSIGGLISSIIVGMEDTNEEMMKRVMASLDHACEIIGITPFYGLLWVSILRSSRCRLGSYKYLMKRWNKSISVDGEEQILDDKMPNRSALVVNALLASLEDESLLIKRAALDFMCTHCKLSDNVFQPTQYLLLVEASLLLFFKLDHGVIRRVKNWFFGEEEPNEEMPVIPMIREAMTRMLSEEQGDPLKILQNWYMQHPETVKMTLKAIGLPLVRYSLTSKQHQEKDLEKATERLMESIASHSELVMRSLYDHLKKVMKEGKQDQGKDAITYIEFALNQMMKQQFGCEKTEDYAQFSSRTECLQEMIILILTGVMQFDVSDLMDSSMSVQVFELGLEAINLIKRRFEFIEQERDHEGFTQSVLVPQSFKDVIQHDTQIIQEYSDYYIRLSEFALQWNDDRIFPLATEILYKLQLYIMKQGEVAYHEIPSWLHQLFKSMSGTSLQATQSISVIVEILKSSEGSNCHMLSNYLTRNSYYGISPISEQQSLAQCKLKPAYDESVNYVKCVLERLWSLLDYTYHNNQVVEYLLYLSKQFEHVFVYVIEQSLVRDMDQRRFQIFCRVTNSFYKKNQKLVNGAGVLMMLNYLEHENPLLRYNSRTWLSESAPCFFRILDPLIGRLEQLREEVKEGKYNSALVVETIKKLQLLYSAKEWLVPYIQTHKPFNEEKESYLFYLARLISSFVVTSTRNQETSKINAISAEFFEVMMNNITAPQMKYQIIKEYLKSFLEKTEEVIQFDDPILQIQMLNIIKVFVLSSNQVQEHLMEHEKHFLIDVYQSSLFFPTLISGLKQAKFFYLKSRYLNIIVTSIYALSDMLQTRELTDRVVLIVTNLLHLLKKCEYNTANVAKSDVYLRRTSYLDQVQQARKTAERYEFVIDNLHTLSQDHQSKLNGSGENFEEVMSLSNAIRAIMSYFFQFKYEIKDIESKPNVAGILVDILTLNLWKPKGDKKQEKKEMHFKQHQDTCQSMLKLFPNILTSFLECWRLQLYWDFLTTKGCRAYEYQSFEDFDRRLKEQLSKHEEDFSDQDQIKFSILQLIMPCAHQFTPQIISAMLQIWLNEYSTNFYAEPKSSPQMCKLIELAISLQISADDFVAAYIATPQVHQLITYYNKRASKKGVYHFNYDQAMMENGMLFFLYAYLATCQYKGQKPQQLIRLWNNFLNLTRALLQSRHINTVCFVLELFHLMSWKFSPREVLQEFRKDLHTQIRNNLNVMAEIASIQNRFVSHSNNEPESNLQMVVPFPPVIYEMYEEYIAVVQKDGENTEELRHMYWIQRKIFDPYRQQPELKLPEDDFSTKCALIAMKTLKRLAYITLINTYEASRSERIQENTKDFMNFIFPLMERKDNLIIIEAASELLYSLLKNSKDQLPQLFRPQILDIFNGQEFFKCSSRTLKYWTEIIDLISEKGDLLLDQLGNNNQNLLQGLAGLFTSRNAEIMKRIRGFERVCFIIYSGGLDKYQSKLSNLLDAILNVIKDIRQQPDAIVILIIFCLRILVLRLSQKSLQEVFRKIWPSIVSMLMQIFDRKGKRSNINVLLAGLKLMELFTLFQLEEFYFYQWIFVFDYFGMTIEMKPSEGTKLEIQSPYKFIPYVTWQFPSGQSYAADYENRLYPDQMQQTLFKKMRLVKIKDMKYQSEQDLRQEAVYLCQYLIDINQQRMEVSLKSLEGLIEGEFISLDDYISTIS